MKNDNLQKALENERYEALQQLEDWLELPVLLLSFVWLVLLIVELIWGLNPFLDALVYIIWGIFVLDFLIRFILAPRKLEFIKKNWLTAISLPLPALRLFSILRFARFFRLVRVARQLRLLKVVSSLNRGMRSLRMSLKRRKFGYVISLSVIVTLVAAAAMYAFENNRPEGFSNYAEALYWTAMIMTTLGSEYWPQSNEGRILAFLLSLYAFSIFGFVTATLASYFIGQEAEEPEGELAGAKTLEALRQEIAALRSEVQELKNNRSDLPAD